MHRQAFVSIEPLSASKSPPNILRPARGLSGRPTCRIYARGEVWILELDGAGGGWLDREGFRRRLTFPTLAAAVGYAERHGLDYRIEPPSSQQRTKGKFASSRLPRSWLARLESNGRKGDIYHG